MRHNRSIVNWLGLCALLLLIAGLIRLSGTSQQSAPPKRPNPASNLSSPLSGAVAATQAVPLDSPLLVAVPTPPPAATTPGDAAGLQLTVLHSNDTWGYLTPCG